MISSMTGYGAASARAGEEEIRVEIRSVNHKYCEVKPRLPPDLFPLEIGLVKQVKARLSRGAVEVSARRTASVRAVAPRVDKRLASELVAALHETAAELGLAQNFGVAELAAVEGVLLFEERTLDLEAAQAALTQATDSALDALLAMRQKEGAALAEDLRARVGTLRQLAARVAELQPKSIDAYRARLEERIAELSRGVPVDPQRLAQEVAYFADRVDVAEELTRLESHLAQFEQLLGADVPIGRRLDFLTQEILREINTTGSKSQSADIAQLVVSMKAEAERIREQVQNVE